MLSRLGVSAGQIAAFTVVPSLLVCAMAPLRGQHYPVSDALAHSLILMVGSLGLFGLTMFLRVIIMNDVAAFVAVARFLFSWACLRSSRKTSRRTACFV